MSAGMSEDAGDATREGWYLDNYLQDLRQQTHVSLTRRDQVILNHLGLTLEPGLQQ